MPLFSPKKASDGVNNSAGGTTTSTSFTATLSGSPGTNPAVSLMTGDRVRISVTARIETGGGNYGFCGVAVSGATTVAAADNLAAHQGAVNPGYIVSSRTYVLTGLTPGVNTFTMQYRTNAGTSTFDQRSLTVEAL